MVMLLKFSHNIHRETVHNKRVSGFLSIRNVKFEIGIVPIPPRASNIMGNFQKY